MKKEGEEKEEAAHNITNNKNRNSNINGTGTNFDAVVHVHSIYTRAFDSPCFVCDCLPV